MLIDVITWTAFFKSFLKNYGLQKLLMKKCFDDYTKLVGAETTYKKGNFFFQKEQNMRFRKQMSQTSLKTQEITF